MNICESRSDFKYLTPVISLMYYFLATLDLDIITTRTISLAFNSFITYMEIIMIDPYTDVFKRFTIYQFLIMK